MDGAGLSVGPKGPGKSRKAKIAAACDACRDRKSKCDGVKPGMLFSAPARLGSCPNPLTRIAYTVCTSCQSRQGRCQWSLRRGRGPGVSQAELRLLKLRLHELESKHRDSTLRRPTSSRSFSTALETAEDDMPRSSSAMASSKATAAQSSPGDDSSEQWSPRNHDGSQLDTRTSSTPLSIQQTALSGGGTVGSPLLQQQHILLTRWQADHLFALYWRCTTYTYLDIEQITPLYHRLLAGDDLGSDGPVFRCLLNMMFGMSCIMDSDAPTGQRSRDGYIFYQRARGLINTQLMCAQSLLALQCFLLIGEYLQNDNDPECCWTYTGLAIRLSQRLRLHEASTSAHASTVHKRETLRRLWHSCVLLDRAMALRYGHPVTITAQAATAVPRPLPHEDFSVCYCHDGDGDAERQNSGHFFIELLRLYGVLHEIWSALYGPASEEKPGASGSLSANVICPEDARTIFELDNKLWSLTKSWPATLRPDPTGRRTKDQQRRANSLWLAHRHIRLLCFRPVLIRMLYVFDHDGVPEETGLAFRLAEQFAVTCIETAMETIDFLDAITWGAEHPSAILPWSCPARVYLSSASSLLTVAQRNPHLNRLVPGARIDRAQEKATNILKTFLSHFPDRHRYRTVTDQHSQNAGMQPRLPGEPPHLDPSLSMPERLYGQDGQHSDSAELSLYRCSESSTTKNPSPLGETASASRFSHLTSAFSSEVDLANLSDIAADVPGLTWLAAYSRRHDEHGMTGG